MRHSPILITVQYLYDQALLIILVHFLKIRPMYRPRNPLQTKLYGNRWSCFRESDYYYSSIDHLEVFDIYQWSWQALGLVEIRGNVRCYRIDIK